MLSYCYKSIRFILRITTIYHIFPQDLSPPGDYDLFRFSPVVICWILGVLTEGGGAAWSPPPSLRILLLQPTFEKESEENLTSGIMNSCKPTTPATVNVLWRRLPCLVRMKLLKVYSTDNNPHILTVIRIRRLSMTTALIKRHVDARHWSKMSSKR